MKEPIISVSGLRGIVGESLTPEVAARFACAYAAFAPPGNLVLTRDGRASGPMLAAAIRAALLGMGRTCIDADVAATPTTGVIVRHLGAAGGIQISASHNPPQWNGLKLFNAEGRVISAADGQQVIEQYRQGHIPWASYDSLGRVADAVATDEVHWELVRETVNVERIRSCHFKVLLDSNHGAGSRLGARVLDELGCQKTILGSYPDGLFEHPPEPTEENLRNVRQQVVAAKANIGFCQDPDADRLAVIDENGRYIGEEYTLAICVDHVLRATPGPVVTNCSTSRMSEDLAAKYGVPFFRSAVGEANVTAAMLEHEAVIGGEGNGGVIDPRVVYVRDSFVGMALILDAMASCGLPVSALADELPRYEIVKTKVTLAAEKVPAALDALAKHFKYAETDRMDGLRLDWPGKWLLVRASNTEPIVRAIAEAPTAAEAQRLCDEAARVMAG